jgi:hypothetical protein
MLTHFIIRRGYAPGMHRVCTGALKKQLEKYRHDVVAEKTYCTASSHK